MDLLLTPLVTRVLKQYVKRSTEGAGRDLKVSFSRGNQLTLHNLELDLAPLLGSAAALVHVRRAFARRLSITVPWTALTTQPIQVVLDTVELVLTAAGPGGVLSAAPSSAALSEAASRQSLPSAEEEAAAAGGGGGGAGGWFGSTLQSIALRAGLNVTVKLTNVVAKWEQEGQFVAAATFQELLLQTSADDWAHGLQNPDAWLKKECRIQQLSISLDQHAPLGSSSPVAAVSPVTRPTPPGAAAAPGHAHSYQPVLRIASLSLSALLPAFAWLEGADLAGDPFNTTVHVHLSPLHVAINDRQLRWAGSLVALMKSAAAAAQAGRAAEAAAAAAAANVVAGTPSKALPPTSAPGSPATPTLASPPDAGGSPITGGPEAPAAGSAAGSVPRPQAKALGVFGRVWDFLIDEAAYVEAAEGVSPKAGPPAAVAAGTAAVPSKDPGPAPPPQRLAAAMPMHAELQVVLEGLNVALGVVVERSVGRAEPGLGGAAAATVTSVAGVTAQQQHQEAAAAPDLDETLRRLREATASNNVEAAAALQQQLAAALAAANAAPLGQPHLPLFEVAVASVDASISGVAVDLQQLTLRRSTAAAPLLAHALAPDASGGAALGPAEQQALSAAAAAAGSASWVEVLSLEPEQLPASPSPHAQQPARQLAVSVHFYDTAAGPGAAPSGARLAPGQLRCSVVLGRVLLAHAPGFATNLLLLARQYEAGFSAHGAAEPLEGAHLGDAACNSAAARSPQAADGAAEDSSADGDAGDATTPSSSSRPLLERALQPELLLECRVGQAELMALSSQAPDAAAVAVLLRRLELRSGALNWDAPWNSRLRNALPAPPQGFGGHGLRLNLAAAELAVADSAAGAAAGYSGLWQLQRGSAVSNIVVLDALIAAQSTDAGDAAGRSTEERGGAPRQLVASAALAPLQLQLSGHQCAAVAAVAGGAAAEAAQGFAVPLLPVSQQQDADLVEPWLASATLSLATGMQVAYAAAGGLQHWHGPHSGNALSDQAGSSSNGSKDGGHSKAGGELFVGLGTITAAVASSPATASAAAQPTGDTKQALQQVLLQVQLVQAHAWLQPGLAVRIPAAEVRLGHAPAEHQASPALLPEPVLLLAGLAFSRRSWEEQPDSGSQEPPTQPEKQLTRSAVQLASISVSIGASDYPLVVELLRCMRQQPALAAVPALQPAASWQRADGSAPDKQQQQQAVQQIHGGSQEAESELLVQVDAASVSVWPSPWQQQQQDAHEGVAQHTPGPGIALWLTKLQMCSQERAWRSTSSSSSSTKVTLGTACAMLLRRRQQGSSSGAVGCKPDSSPVEYSYVLQFPDLTAGLQRVQTAAPALHFTLGSSSSSRAGLSPSKGAAAGGRQLQLQVAPISLAISSDLLAAVCALSSDLDSSKSAAAFKEEPPPQPQPKVPEELAGLQGKAALQGLRLLLLQSASWDEAASGRQGAAAPAGGWQPPAGAAAVEVAVEEAVVLLQQAPVAENRPWLCRSASAAALLTSMDASLIGAAITVWHAGKPGADATAVLPPTDGRLQLLLQPHTGAAAVAVHVQLLPLQVSLPAISAISTLVSALSNSHLSAGQESVQGKQAAAAPGSQRHQQVQASTVPGSPRATPPSAAAVAAAATVIIEDASATLGQHHHHHSGREAAAVATQHERPSAPPSVGIDAAAQPPCAADDLSAALFTFVHSSGHAGSSSRPAPLQVQIFSGSSSDGQGGGEGEGRSFGSRLGARLWGGARQEAPATGGEAAALQHGIRFCYPQPREVLLLAIEDAPAALLAATFQLRFYSAEHGAYLPLQLQAVMLDSIGGASGSSKVLVLLAEEAVSAAEWEVCWELPQGAGSAAHDGNAAAVLRRLQVNPRACSEAATAVAGLGRQLALPPPLTASLTVALTAESASVALLAPAPVLLPQGHSQHMHKQSHTHQLSAAVACLDTAALLHAGGFKLAVHKYPAPEGCTQLAVDLQAALALCLPDSSSATAPAASAAATAAGWAVLEPFQLDAAVEYSSVPSRLPVWQDRLQQRHGQEDERSRGDVYDDAQQQLQRLTFWQTAGQAQQLQELPLLAVRLPPLRHGLALHLAADHEPVVVNASEGSLAEIKRLIATLSSPSCGDAVQGSTAQGPEGAAAAATSAPPLLLTNRCGLALRLRQQGMPHHAVLVQEGQQLPLVWPAPPALVPGAARRLQFALAAAGEDDAAWSEPVDIMTAGGRQLVLPTTDSAAPHSSMAVHVRQRADGSGWEVLVLPSVAVCNRLATPVHACLSRDVAVRASSGRAVLQQQHDMLEVGSGGTANAQLHGPGSLIRLWLGGDLASGAGWSQAITLPDWQQQQQQEPILMVLHCSPAAAASAMGAGVRSPSAPDAATRRLGAVLAQLLPPDTATGQARVCLWPPLLLRNAMPCPVLLQLPRAGAAAGPIASWQAAAAQPGGGEAQQQVVLQPGDSCQLAVPLQGGVVGALLALEAATSGAHAGSYDLANSCGTGSSRRALPVVVPPLIAESAEQRWFGGSAGTEQAGAGKGSEAGPQIFIAPPAEATSLQLPLVVGAPWESLAAPSAECSGSSSSSSDGRAELLADCLLVTERQPGGPPLLQLTLQPTLAVHNCLPVPLLFQPQLPGAPPVEVPAGMSLPLPAGSSGADGPAEEAVVMLSLAAGGGTLSSGSTQTSQPALPSQQQDGQRQGTRRLLLKSQPFKLDGEEESGGSGSTHLLLATERPGLQRTGSGLWRSASAGSSAPEPRLECRLAVQVEARQHSAAGGAATAAAVSVTITAGCFVSNLTGLPLAMLTEGAAAHAVAGPPAAASQPGGEGLQQHGQTQTGAAVDGLPSPEPSLLSLPSESSIASVGSSSLGATVPGDGNGGVAQQATLLPHAATVPLLQLWRSGGGRRSRSQRQGSWGSTADMLRSFSGGLLPTAVPQEAAPGGAAASRPVLRFALVGNEEAAAVEGQAAGGGSGADSVPATLPTTLQQVAGQLSPGMPAASAGHRWSRAVAPFAAAGRQRLFLEAPPGAGSGDIGEGGTGSVMLTHRVLLNRGSFHLVLFRDQQPPFVIQNATTAAMDIGYFPPVEASDGSFRYDGPAAALRVGPGHTLECDFKPASSQGGNGSGAAGATSPRRPGSGGGSGGGGWEDQEDEDAFLDCLLREELHAAGQAQQRPPPVLKFRPAGSTEWQHPCVLLPGMHLATAGDGGGGASGGASSAALLGEVHISKCCATTRILLLPGEGAATSGTAAAAGSAADEQARYEEEKGLGEQPPLPLWIEVQCSQLQVCLWDDERQRLLPGGTGGSTSGGVVVLPVGRELFSLSLDRLNLLLARQQFVASAADATAGARVPGSAGAAGPGRRLHPWQRQVLTVMAACLTAESAQLDSFLPGSEQPVLLTCLPPDDIGAASSAARHTRPGPPLQLLLEVHHCVPKAQLAAPPLAPKDGCTGSGHAGSNGGSESMSLRNAWVRDLLIQLPTLAAAADDALLLFVDRLSSLLSASGGDGSGASSNISGAVDGSSSGSSGAASGSPAPLIGGAGAGSSSPASRMELLQQSLAVEAAGAAASRLYIEQAVVESVHLLLDAHITAGTAGVPVAVDTYRAPVTLSRIAAHDVLFRPHILVRGLMAHGVAEALLNAPQVLGSLSLLFNPTGLVHSVRAGVSDLIGLPLAALQNQSLAQFISGLGQGSVSLVKHTLGWTLTSISGFSQAFSRAVDSAVTLRSTATGAGAGVLAHRPPPSHLGHGLTQGLAGLAEGVTAGITGVVRAPLQGYSSGSGVLGGIGRGLLGVVGLPVSGALELVGSVSAGLASTAGVVHVPQPRRFGRVLLPAVAGGNADGSSGAAPAGDAAAVLAAAEVPVTAAAARLMQHPALLRHFLTASSSSGTGGSGCSGVALQAGLGRCLGHASLQSAMVLQGADGLRSAHFARGFALQHPVLLLTERAAVLFSGGGLEAVLVLVLADTESGCRYASHEASLFSRTAAPAGQPGAAAPAAVLCRLSREAWLRLTPLLRQRCRGAC